MAMAFVKVVATARLTLMVVGINILEVIVIRKNSGNNNTKNKNTNGKRNNNNKIATFLSAT